MKKNTLPKSISKSIDFNRSKLIKQQIICIIFVLTIIQYVFPHGTVTSPPSRVWNCYQEGPESPDSAACIDAVASHGTQPLYDWNEINQANANSEHMLYVMNGNLPSGGRPDKYGGMDQVRTDWVATPVSPGPYTVTWTNSAPHATSYYSVYITKDDWTPDQVLTWESLTPLVTTSASVAEYIVDIPVVLPFRTGKHVIYSIWQRSDSQEAFYSTSDIDFGDVLSIDDFHLDQNYPNPFTSTSTISYSLRDTGLVSIKVYDVLGKEISTLVNKKQPAGEYKVVFNGENLNSGLYFCVFKVGSFIETRRLILNR
ncbi:lytic polysaccharide monooxygenase [uncultured Lacinutrix sp.]|uniref:lytic polysaccharide monooxygenase n=1 Tax=uncultured Lacinutrix sp. TaxID=574032 RepID=UPI00262B10FD|nr:lytic polysaccharide monooxygenase [uncultured Lacinutrix sp.]